MNQEVSLRDVARVAGVSVSTASRVLSGSSHPVSEGARSRVRTAATELGFEPNRLAQALATARSRTIGVVVHNVSDPYFAHIIRGLEDVAGPRDHALFVTSSDRDPEKEISLIRAFVAHRVDAIVLVASGITTPGYHQEVTGVLRRFEERGGIVVVMAEHSYAAPRVTYDNAAASAMVTRHLIELGHRRIGHLAGPPALAVTEARQRGYRQALDEAGLDADDSLVESGWFGMDESVGATRRLMERAAPTALVAANDLMAFGALRSLLDEGVSVPDEVSVVGFDDVAFAAYASVPLTTVRIPLIEFGRQGAGVVFSLLEGTEPDPWPEVTPELVVRSSSGLARALR